MLSAAACCSGCRAALSSASGLAVAEVVVVAVAGGAGLCAMTGAAARSVVLPVALSVALADDPVVVALSATATGGTGD